MNPGVVKKIMGIYFFILSNQQFFAKKNGVYVCVCACACVRLSSCVCRLQKICNSMIQFDILCLIFVCFSFRLLFLENFVLKLIFLNDFKNNQKSMIFFCCTFKKTNNYQISKNFCTVFDYFCND